MADEKRPSGPPSPEAEATTRINALHNEIKKLEGDAKTLEGRFANSDPAIAKRLQAENKMLKDRLANLEKALFCLLQDTLVPRQPDDQKTQYEVLRLAAVEFCKRANINPEIWKNIAY